jgi:hypothetical protein
MVFRSWSHTQIESCSFFLPTHFWCLVLRSELIISSAILALPVVAILCHLLLFGIFAWVILSFVRVHGALDQVFQLHFRVLIRNLIVCSQVLQPDILLHCYHSNTFLLSDQSFVIQFLANLHISSKLCLHRSTYSIFGIFPAMS